jgi:hypothetical protein
MNEFRIYTRDDGKKLEDWTPVNPLSDDEINSIPDTVMTGFGNKSGTSIPTALARLFLFDHALKTVNSSENDILSSQTGNTSNHELVSQLLDLLELIYSKPNKLSFRNWDFNKEVSRLQKSASSKHKSLKQSLANTWENLKNSLKDEEISDIPEPKGLHLIYYDGILLGGTSPLTIVFTSPNLVKDLKAAGKEILGTKGNHLFYNPTGNYRPLALHERDDDFRKFLLQYRVKYTIELSQQAKTLFEYLSKNNTNNPPEINEIDHQKFEDSYPPIEGNITVIGLPLRCKSQIPDPNVIKSEFVIKPTVDYYKTMRHNGADKNIYPPLVIAKGSHDLVYWNGAKWDVSFENQLMNIRDINLWDRELPGFGVRYPYLTIGDFLEDKIIQLDYKINKDKFFTGIKSDSGCLLPIRKEYFNYFKIEDLENQLTITEDSVNKTITIRLAIPIVGNRRKSIKEMVFEKKYAGEDIVKNNIFGIGIYPFYQTDQPNVDNYCIMLGDTSQKIELDFYRFENIAGGRKVETDKKQKRGTRTYIHLENNNTDNRFDCIVIKCENTSGLIIPRFQSVKVQNGTGNNSIFCVDFGTSNTHIACLDGNNVTAFSIDKKDQQMVMLNYYSRIFQGESYGLGSYFELYDEHEREFFPTFISATEEISFPLRTAVFESNELSSQTMDLFGNVNLAFDLSKVRWEGQNPGGQKYVVDLKWAKPNNLQDKRIAAFCKQIIWMIKNKCLQNTGRLDPVIIWTRPEAMNQLMKDFYGKKWENAVKEIYGDKHAVELKDLSEAVAPYYAFVDYGMKTNNALNIDIGGGTTDILYITAQKAGESVRQGYSSSVHFAANDLWGDGITKHLLKHNKNGFYLLLRENEKNITYSSPEVALTYQFYIAPDKKSEFSSSDVIGFAFNHEEFKLSDYIKENKHLYSLIFIHYAAILYFIAQFIKKRQLTIPENITFSGKGSLYINMITTDNEALAAFTQLLLKKFSGLEIPKGFNVQFNPSPKEITAEGAVYGYGQTEIKENKFKHFGFEDDTDVNSSYTIGDIETMKLREKVLKNFEKFLSDLTEDRDIYNYLNNNYDISFSDELIERIKDEIEDSFNAVYNTVNNDVKKEIPETMFFWTLKDTLYRVSSQK